MVNPPKKTAIALELLPEFEAEASKRQARALEALALSLRHRWWKLEKKGEAIDEAARTVGISGTDTCTASDRGSWKRLVSRPTEDPAAQLPVGRSLRFQQLPHLGFE